MRHKSWHGDGLIGTFCLPLYFYIRCMCLFAATDDNGSTCHHINGVFEIKYTPHTYRSPWPRGVNHRLTGVRAYRGEASIAFFSPALTLIARARGIVPRVPSPKVSGAPIMAERRAVLCPLTRLIIFPRPVPQRSGETNRQAAESGGATLKTLRSGGGVL